MQEPEIGRFMRMIESVFVKVSGGLSRKEFISLLYGAHHSPLVQRRRATLIISRVRMVSALFAVLTPMWIFADMIVFDWPLWGILGAGRILASIAFAVLALSFRQSEVITDAYQALGMLLTIPTTFYLFSHPVLSMYQMSEIAQAVTAGYSFLPFVMVAGLAVFPLTLLEGALFSLPLVAAVVFVTLLQFSLDAWSAYVATVWLLGLISVVATLSGMSQLHFMMALVNQASHDVLTKAFTRRCGEELLEMQYRLAVRQNSPLALAFVDLDKFKSINDEYGHEEGDMALKQAAAALGRLLRRGDILVRWGGEEFLVMMPHTDADGVKTAMLRIRSAGLGLRPDGNPLTASMGVSERVCDDTESWAQLVEVADQRMYTAKQSGRDRVVLCDGDVLCAANSGAASEPPEKLVAQ